MLPRGAFPTEAAVVGPGFVVTPGNRTEQICRQAREEFWIGDRIHLEHLPRTEELQLPPGWGSAQGGPDGIGEDRKLNDHDTEVDLPSGLVLGQEVLLSHPVKSVHPDLKSVPGDGRR